MQNWLLFLVAGSVLLGAYSVRQSLSGILSVHTDHNVEDPQRDCRKKKARISNGEHIEPLELCSCVAGGYIENEQVKCECVAADVIQDEEAECYCEANGYIQDTEIADRCDRAACQELLQTWQKGVDVNFVEVCECISEGLITHSGVKQQCVPHNQCRGMLQKWQQSRTPKKVPNELCECSDSGLVQEPHVARSCCQQDYASFLTLFEDLKDDYPTDRSPLSDLIGNWNDRDVIMIEQWLLQAGPEEELYNWQCMINGLLTSCQVFVDLADDGHAEEVKKAEEWLAKFRPDVMEAHGSISTRYWNMSDPAYWKNVNPCADD